MLKRVCHQLILSLMVLTHGVGASDPPPSIKELSTFRLKESIVRHTNTFGTRNIRIVWDESLAKQQNFFIALTKEALPIAEKILGLDLKDDIEIYFDSKFDFHNGYATVMPVDRIAVFVEPPEIASSIGLSGDYLYETIVHELAHMLIMQQREGAFKVLSRLFGNTARPNGSWPRWIHEGMAVWVESRLEREKGIPALGGRPGSGYLHMIQRQYAEYFKREQKHPMDSSDMDGKREQKRVSEGALPYAFGYLIIEKVAQKHGEEWPGKFANQSSDSLGVSFRRTFNKTVEPLDALFEDLRTEWSQTPLPPNTARDSALVVAQKDHITGPFIAPQTYSWIEVDADRTQVEFVAKEKSGAAGERRLLWTHHLLAPEQVFALANNKWLVLSHEVPQLYEGGFFNPSVAQRRFLSLYNDNGEALCRLKAPNRIREIAVSNTHIAWIRTGRDFNSIVEKAKFDPETCSLSTTIELVAKTNEPFERISNLYLDDKDTLYSQSKGRNSYAERLFINGKEFHSSGRALTNAIPLRHSSQCPKASSCYLVQEYSKEAWAPLLLVVDAKGNVQSYKFPHPTGTSQFVELTNGSIVMNSLLWEKDVLEQMNLTAWTQKGPDIRPGTSSEHAGFEVQSKASEKEKIKPYQSIEAAFPKFWIPSFSVSNNNIGISAATFTEDVASRWDFQGVAGLNTYTARPFFQAQLGDNYFSPEFARGNILVFYDPYISPLGGIVDLLGLNLQMTAIRAFPLGDHIATFSPGLLAFPTFGALAPYGQLTLRSARGVDPNVIKPRVAAANLGYFYSARPRIFVGADFYHSLSARAPLATTGIQVQFEQAFTSLTAAKYGLYEWGSTPSFSTSGSGRGIFLSRGFNRSYAASSDISRFAVEWGYSLGKIGTQASWNRAKLSFFDQRWIVETVTTNQHMKTFYTSLGLENDIFGSYYHYIGFKFTVGLYKGFGPYGATRAALSFKSYLDL